MSNYEKISGARACLKILIKRESEARDPQVLAKAKQARQEMQMHLSQLHRKVREEK